MTDRLADVTARIEGIRQLGAVVNAMTGIAAARARQAREQLGAVDSYTRTVADAIGRVAGLAVTEDPPGAARLSAPRRVLVVFCAEQGFAGAFSERVLDALATELGEAQVFLIGSRGAAVAEARGLEPVWTAAMPSHSPGVPKLADRIVQAVSTRLGADEVERIDAAYSASNAGRVVVTRRRLLPLDVDVLRSAHDDVPLMNVAPAPLLAALTGDYLHARMCSAALHAFAAENEARMTAMAAARRQIERELTGLRAEERRVRQEAITAEIIELATGELASRSRPRRR